MARGTVALNLWISDEEHIALRDYAERCSITKTEAARRAIRAYFYLRHKPARRRVREKAGVAR